MDYKTIRHHLDVLLKNGVITMEGDKYGAMYFISKALEANLNEFNQIWEKIDKQSKSSQQGGNPIQITEIAYYITAGNIVLLLVLLVSYIEIYRKIKSNFTLGLIIFTLALLLQSLSRAVLLLLIIANPPPVQVYPLIVNLLGYNPIYVVIPDALEFIALSILLYFTRE